jgi:hypothetical protein
MIINYTSAGSWLYVSVTNFRVHSCFFGLPNKVGRCPSMTHVVDSCRSFVLSDCGYFLEQLINISSLSTLVVQVLNTWF